MKHLILSLALRLLAFLQLHNLVPLLILTLLTSMATNTNCTRTSWIKD